VLKEESFLEKWQNLKDIIFDIDQDMQKSYYDRNAAAGLRSRQGLRVARDIVISLINHSLALKKEKKTK